MRRVLTLSRLLFAAAAIAAVAGCAQRQVSPLPQRHMVAAANPHAAAAGLEILREGGSAVDAAIAVQAVLTLVEPQSSGIGGGAFLLHYDAATGKVSAFDGRETAPASARPDMFLTASGAEADFLDAVVGGRSVGVPGLLRMLEMAHARFGRLPWRRLFQPAIRLARKGFAVSPRLHAMISRARHLRVSPAARAYFFTDAGDPLPVGAVLRNPALARTLSLIAERGARAFYEGGIARDVAAAVRSSAANPGGMTAADIAAYRPREREALCRPYRIWRICAMPPPTSGGIAVLQILGILERFDLAGLEPGSARAVHLVSEASRLAFADRAVYVADPDFVEVPVSGLLDAQYLARRARLIEPDRTMGKAAAGTPFGADRAKRGADSSLELPSTSHISVVDDAGNAVSMTGSIEYVFGSGLMVHGFLLNNELTDFSFAPVEDGRPVANRVEPGKRPRSSMSPVIVLDRNGRLAMAVGSPGGSRIIAYVVKTLTGVLDWGLSMQEAIDLPNHANRNGPTDLERGTALAAIAPELRAMGHEVRFRPLVSGLHGILVTPRGLDGGADRRREGVAVGD